MPTVHATARDDELGAILHGLQALQQGDPSIRLPEQWTGTAGQVAKAFNQVARQRNAAEHPAEPNGRTASDDYSIAVLAGLLAVKKGRRHGQAAA